jgi:hypothetical protein
VSRSFIALTLIIGFFTVHQADPLLGEEQARSNTPVPAKRGRAPDQGQVSTAGQIQTGESGQQPSDDASEHQFVGEISMFAGNYAPQGWALCDGRLLAVQDHQRLFAVVGTLYGGDGRTDFGLPDLQGRLGVSFIISLKGRYPPRG